jgi:hypothetical protein
MLPICVNIRQMFTPAARQMAARDNSVANLQDNSVANLQVDGRYIHLADERTLSIWATWDCGASSSIDTHDRRRGLMNHESRAVAGEGSSQCPSLAVLSGKETRSIDVDDDRIVAIDEIRDSPHLDRVAPGFNISPEPGRAPARTGRCIPEVVERLHLPAPQVDDEILRHVIASP